MAIAGAFAGVGGAIYYLSGTAQFNIVKTLVPHGLQRHPRGAAGLVEPRGHHLLGAVRVLHTGGRRDACSPSYAKEIIDIIIAAIIYLSAFALLVQGGISRRLLRPQA